MRWTSGSASRSITVLSSSVSSPSVTSSISLPRSRDKIVDQAAEAAEQRCRSAPCARPSWCRAVRAASRSTSSAMAFICDSSLALRDLLQPRLGDDQLADPVHQLVEPLGRNADAAAGLRAGRSGTRRLLGRRRRGLLRRLVRHRSGFRRRRLHGRRFGNDGNIVTFLERAALGAAGLRRLLDALDTQFHVVEQKQEDLLDGLARRGRPKQHIPADVTFAGVELIERRDRIGLRHHRRFAEIVQFFDHQQWIGAGRHGAHGQPEADAPRRGPAFRRRHVGRRDIGWRRVGARTGDHVLQTRQDLLTGRLVDLVGGLDKQAHAVLRGQRQLDQVRGCLDLSLADPIKSRLDMMGESGEPVETEHRPRTFEGMQRAKRTIDQIAVRGPMFEVEQDALELFQQLLRLLPKSIVGVADIARCHEPRTFLTTATS